MSPRHPLPQPALSRRQFIQSTAAATAAAGLGMLPALAGAQVKGDRPPAAPEGVTVLNPMGRVPVSLIIDDSTCLVNLNRFAVPQFAEAWAASRALDPQPPRFEQKWRDWPHEIPDAFVLKFAAWCGENGVKGKYSVVPYPACVGRLDRVLPGWANDDVQRSIRVVRDEVMPNWDVHPEMVTHTWVIDPRTGHPHPERTVRFMENWIWSVGRSADELAEYMTYALRILREVGLPCEGITTPGGFGNRALRELSLATLQSVRDVFRAEVPHYFRHLYDKGDQSLAPRVELASGLDGDDPRCVVSIVGCTGDWTGGWDCSEPGGADLFITPDLQKGRMVDVIGRGEPACMVCHWTGIYFNGQEIGFKIFQEVVGRLRRRYGDGLVWMKLSEIARYWAAKELTRIEREPDGRTLTLQAPFACPQFTVRVSRVDGSNGAPTVATGGGPAAGLEKVREPIRLRPGTFLREKAGGAVTACFPLAKGRSQLRL